MLIYYLPPQVSENLWHGVQASVFLSSPDDSNTHSGMRTTILDSLYVSSLPHLYFVIRESRFTLHSDRKSLSSAGFVQGHDCKRVMFVSCPFSSCGFSVAGLWTLPQTTQPSSLNICCFKDSTELNFLKGEERLTLWV